MTEPQWRRVQHLIAGQAVEVEEGTIKRHDYEAMAKIVALARQFLEVDDSMVCFDHVNDDTSKLVSAFNQIKTDLTIAALSR